MPVPALSNIARQSGKSAHDVERYWSVAKDQAAQEGQANNDAYIMGIVKNRCGLHEVYLDDVLELVHYETKNPYPFLKNLQEMSWLPKPFLSNLEWAVADALVTSPILQRNIEDQNVFMHDIEPTQSRHDPEIVKQYANSGNTTGGLAFARHGQIHLYDGHHRFYAAMRNQSPNTRLKVLKLSDEVGKDGMSLQDFAKLLGVRVKSILSAMSLDDRRHYEDLV